MNDPLYDILLDVYGSEAEIARVFKVERVTHWRNRVPEHAAFKCHFSPKVPYTYDVSVYGNDWKGLGLDLNNTVNLTTNFEVTTNDQELHQNAA
ncbi:hypothetical protein [Enterovibrio sp. 27052020O]|uniref:hypothetical protein n=1 Tax=Enterovibrio sp. 27052020O TaxID=3241166 RepID=UPI00388D3034